MKKSGLIAVVFNEEIRDPALKQIVGRDFRARWGYISQDTYDALKAYKDGDKSLPHTVFLPDGTTADVHLEHGVQVIPPFAKIEDNLDALEKK